MEFDTTLLRRHLNTIHTRECVHAGNSEPWYWGAGKTREEVLVHVDQLGLHLCGTCNPLSTVPEKLPDPALEAVRRSRAFGALHLETAPSIVEDVAEKFVEAARPEILIEAYRFAATRVYMHLMGSNDKNVTKFAQQLADDFNELAFQLEIPND